MKRAHGNFKKVPMRAGESVKGKYAVIPDVADPTPGGRMLFDFMGGRHLERWFGMCLSRVPLVPEAQKVFGDKIGERLDTLAARVASEEGERKPDVSRCWACGIRCPTGNSVGRGASRGWASRPMPNCEKETETYCTKCFAKWGWGDA